MIVGRYAPGRRQAVVTDHGVVVVGADVPLALLERVWLQASAGRGLPAVLEALTGAFGTSLAAIPPFAVALQEATGVRLVVRGGLEIDVETATGVESLSGAGVTTWTERSLPGVRRVSIVDGTDAGAAEYPICDGIVLVSAIRVDFGDDAAGEPVASESSTAPVASPEPVAPPVPAMPAASVEEPAPVESVPPIETVRETKDDEAEPADAAEPAGAAEPVDAVEPADEPELEDAPPAAPVLIDSATVLTATGADTLLPGDSTFARATSPATEADEASVDNELAATVARPVPAPTEGDHDGATISVAEARRLRGVDSDSAPPPLAPPRPPAPGRVRLSTGQVLLLDRTVVIGRRPRSTRVVGTDLPHLVAVASPEQDISRSHVELRAEGDSIVATDLHTTNGTTLHRPGADPVRLHPGEATVVVTGDLLDLGDGVTVVIEDVV